MLGRSRLSEHYLGLRQSPCLRDCGFAHALADLDVPNESQHQGAWSQVWKSGDVDIQFWHNATRSDQSMERFRSAFNWERCHSPSQIPNWAWGLAIKDGLIGDDDLPNVPRDFDWIRLQKAWGEGLKGTMGGTRAAVRAVVDSPTLMPSNSTRSLA